MEVEMVEILLKINVVGWDLWWYLKYISYFVWLIEDNFFWIIMVNSFIKIVLFGNMGFGFGLKNCDKNMFINILFLVGVS